MQLIKMTFLGALIASFGLIGQAALADSHKTPADTSFDLEEITCWEVVTLPEAEAAYSMLLLYGYSAGKNGQSTLVGDDIGSVLAKTGTFCEENPDATAYEAMKGAQE